LYKLKGNVCAFIVLKIEVFTFLKNNLSIRNA